MAFRITGNRLGAGALADELDGPITKVQGTGLLFSCELDPVYKAYGTGSAEEYMRFNGIGVIQGARTHCGSLPTSR